MKKKIILSIIFVLALSLSFLSARSTRIGKVPYGNTFSCNLCHTAGGGTPRNTFGQSVEAITGSSPNAEFWDTSLAADDSDGDGFSNGVELQDSAGTWTSGSADPGDAGEVTHPGDASDYPSTSNAAIVPAIFRLGNNYPNPFNPITIIAYDLPEPSHVMLEIFSIQGKHIKTMVNGVIPRGTHTAVWDGRNDLGETMNSGIYLYRITAGNFSDMKRMALIK